MSASASKRLERRHSGVIAVQTSAPKRPQRGPAGSDLKPTTWGKIRIRRSLQNTSSIQIPPSRLKGKSLTRENAIFMIARVHPCAFPKREVADHFEIRASSRWTLRYSDPCTSVQTLCNGTRDRHSSGSSSYTANSWSRTSSASQSRTVKKEPRASDLVVPLKPRHATSSP